MATKQGPAVDTSGVSVVEDLHAPLQGESNEAEYVDITGQDELDTTREEEEQGAAPEKAQTRTRVPAKGGSKKAAPDGDEVPTEFKGKSLGEVIKMYREAHSALGRQGSEIGELRRIVDGYLRQRVSDDAKRTPAKGDQPEGEFKEPDAVEFFSNPSAAISKMIENHPALKKLGKADQEFAAREMVRQRQTASETFSKQHPDAGEVLVDPEFREWIVASPIRKALLLRAHQHYDVNAANEVFSTWKELKKLRSGAPKEETVPGRPVQAPKPAADRAAARVPSGGNATPHSDTKPQKFYRRSDIIKMMIDDPDTYAMRVAEFDKAYAEGRVK